MASSDHTSARGHIQARRKGEERGSVAWHTHKKEGGSWATVACFSARLGNRFLYIVLMRLRDKYATTIVRDCRM